MPIRPQEIRFQNHYLSSCDGSKEPCTLHGGCFAVVQITRRKGGSSGAQQQPAQGWALGWFLPMAQWPLRNRCPKRPVTPNRNRHEHQLDSTADQGHEGRSRFRALYAILKNHRQVQTHPLGTRNQASPDTRDARFIERGVPSVAEL